MNYDEQGIKALMALNEADARNLIVSKTDFEKVLSSVKTELNKVEPAAPWADVADIFYYVADAFKNIEAVYSAIDRGLKIRAAAIEAKRICDAGFNFDQIEIDGVYLHRTLAGICEHEFYDEDNNIAF